MTTKIVIMHTNFTLSDRERRNISNILGESWLVFAQRLVFLYQERYIHGKYPNYDTIANIIELAVDDPCSTFLFCLCSHLVDTELVFEALKAVPELRPKVLGSLKGCDVESSADDPDSEEDVAASEAPKFVTKPVQKQPHWLDVVFPSLLYPLKDALTPLWLDLAECLDFSREDVFVIRRSSDDNADRVRRVFDLAILRNVTITKFRRALTIIDNATVNAALEEPELAGFLSKESSRFIAETNPDQQ